MDNSIAGVVGNTRDRSLCYASSYKCFLCGIHGIHATPWIVGYVELRINSEIEYLIRLALTIILHSSYINSSFQIIRVPNVQPDSRNSILQPIKILALLQIAT